MDVNTIWVIELVDIPISMFLGILFTDVISMEDVISSYFSRSSINLWTQNNLAPNAAINFLLSGEFPSDI